MEEYLHRCLKFNPLVKFILSKSILNFKNKFWKNKLFKI